MDFELDAEQAMLRDTTRELLGRSYDAEKRNEVSASERGWKREVWKQCADLGLLGLPFSEADGGMGAGPVETMVVMTELGRALAPEPYLGGVLIPGALIAERGSAEQRSRCLPELSAGTMLAAFANSEPGSRWPTTTVTTAASERDGAWTVTGVKNPVLQGDSADVLVVSAALPGGGTGLFIVDPGAAGVTRTTYVTHDGRRGAQYAFADAPAEQLGEGGDAGAAIEASDIRAQAALCAEAVGAMEEALRLTTDYLKQRKQFGVPLAKFQALTHRAADMYVTLELARSMSLYATMSIADGVLDPVIASRVKLSVGRAARAIGEEAVQMHGGIGMTAEYPVGHYVSRLVAIEHTLGGSDDHLRVLAADVANHTMVDVTK